MKIVLHTPIGLSEVGQRTNNEDCIYPSLEASSFDSSIFMVCDGVGGAAKGEVASAICCSLIPTCLNDIDELDETVIQQALEKAEQQFAEHIEAHPEAAGMATTMTLFAIDQKGIILAHIGDSRIYQIRNGQIVHKTMDHSLVNEMVAAQIITEEEAINHPQKNVITRVIGMQIPEVDVFRVNDVMEGDYFLLCTDGILEGIKEEDLLALLTKDDDSNEQKMMQIKTTCEEHSKDNFSVYLLQVSEVEKNLVETINQIYSNVIRKIS